ncbi:MAG: alpha/beta hydrolase [Deltaproteobacteria bacterium]|nr:MAG: alpha/beta hydrolase [Deltaproteobacteria bacterium]
MSPETTTLDHDRRVSALRALQAAAPFVRRRLQPPALEILSPTCTLRYSDRARGRPLPLADIYRPAQPQGAPTAILVHGGGFLGGRRDMSSVAVLATDLVRRGFLVASIDYCLARPFGPGLAEQVEDVRLALRWWMDEAKNQGGDPARTALVGLSAGGALALLAHEEGTFERFVGIYGAYDFRLLPARWATVSLLTRRARRTEHLRHSPLLRGDFAQPALLVHGVDDPLAPKEHTLRLAELRRQAGLPTQTVLLPGAVHGYLQDGAAHPHSIATFEAIGSFLDPLLRAPEPT